MQRHHLTIEEYFIMPTLPHYVECEDLEEGDIHFNDTSDDYIKLVSRQLINIIDERESAPRLHSRFYKTKLWWANWCILDVHRAIWKLKYLIARVRQPVIRIKTQTEKP